MDVSQKSVPLIKGPGHWKSAYTHTEKLQGSLGVRDSDIECEEGPVEGQVFRV